MQKNFTISDSYKFKKKIKMRTDVKWIISFHGSSLYVARVYVYTYPFERGQKFNLPYSVYFSAFDSKLHPISSSITIRKNAQLRFN